MPKLSVWMIRAALLHLGIGFSFGALLLANKGVPFAAAIWHLLEPHIEILLLGWMLQLAMGVSFYALPRYAKQEDRFGKESLGWLSFMLLNTGLICSIAGLFLQEPLASFFGKLIILTGIFAFVWLMFPRVKAFGV